MINCINIDWNILTAVGTIAMAIVALFAYLASLNDKKAKIVIDLIVKKATLHKEECKFWCLRISNIGVAPAKDCKISFDKSFIDNLPLDKDISRLNRIANRTIQIRAGAEFLYILAPIKPSYGVFQNKNAVISQWLEEYRAKPINVYYSYNGQCIQSCESLIIEQYDTENMIFIES